MTARIPPEESASVAMPAPERRVHTNKNRIANLRTPTVFERAVDRKIAKLRTERTPDGFTFNIKPFALMTQHPAEISRLPKQLREMLSAAEQSDRQLTRPSKEVVNTAFQMLRSAMVPLREAGKLGMVAFQFPPYFIPKLANFDYLASLRERLPGASIAIEFRHPSWIRSETRRTETMNFLRSHGLYYTSIDAPENSSIVPSFIEASRTTGRDGSFVTVLSGLLSSR